VCIAYIPIPIVLEWCKQIRGRELYRFSAPCLARFGYHSRQVWCWSHCLFW